MAEWVDIIEQMNTQTTTTYTGRGITRRPATHDRTTLPSPAPVIPAYRISPKIISLLGASLYSLPLPVVLVRELLQNARDAQRRAGTTTPIKITIARANGIISVDDHGDGMSESDILDRFLTIGESAKQGAEVGGFGIAKVAIFSTKNWSVASRDNLLLSERMERGLPMLKVKPRVGTCVSCTIDERIVECELQKILACLVLSDVAVTLTVDGAPVTLPHVTPSRRYDGGVWQAAPVTVEGVTTLHGLNAYRLGGLVQYTEDWQLHNTILVHDIPTTARPGDEDYPLTANREALASWYTDPLTPIANRLNENPLTARVQLTRPPQPVYRYAGTSLTRAASYEPDPVDSDDDPLIVRRDAPAPKPQTKRLLAAWRELLRLVTPDREYCVGVIADPDTVAEREILATSPAGGGIPCYYLHPELAIQGVTTRDGLLLRLYALAVHEATHAAHDSHNERFTSAESQLFSATADSVAAALPRLKRVALRRYPLP
jgi:hypothetical protein